MSSVLDDEYGIKVAAMSVPSIIISKGIERTLADYLNDDEYKDVRTSYEALEEVLEGLNCGDLL